MGELRTATPTKGYTPLLALEGLQCTGQLGYRGPGNMTVAVYSAVCVGACSPPGAWCFWS